MESYIISILLALFIGIDIKYILLCIICLEFLSNLLKYKQYIQNLNTSKISIIFQLYKQCVIENKVLFIKLVILKSIEYILDIIYVYINYKLVYITTPYYIILVVLLKSILTSISYVIYIFNKKLDKEYNKVLILVAHKFLMLKYMSISYNDMYCSKQDLYEEVINTMHSSKYVIYNLINLTDNIKSVVANFYGIYLLDNYLVYVSFVSSILLYKYSIFHSSENFEYNDDTTIYNDIFKRYTYLFDDIIRDNHICDEKIDKVLINIGPKLDYQDGVEHDKELIKIIIDQLRYLILVVIAIDRNINITAHAVTNIILQIEYNLASIKYFINSLENISEIFRWYRYAEKFLSKFKLNARNIVTYNKEIYNNKFDSITINSLSIKLTDTLIIQNNKPLVINPGDRIAFIGESGEGKTTFIKAISSYFHKDMIKENITLYDNATKKSITIESISNKIELINQNTRLIMDTNIKDLIKFTIDNEEKYTTISELISICNLEDINYTPDNDNKRLYTLSGGQETRIKLAHRLNRILYRIRKHNISPYILILDEVDAGLKNGKMNYNIQKNILSLKEFKNTAVISIVHDIDSVRSLYNKVWTINKHIITC